MEAIVNSQLSRAGVGFLLLGWVGCGTEEPFSEGEHAEAALAATCPGEATVVNPGKFTLELAYAFVHEVEGDAAKRTHTCGVPGLNVECPQRTQQLASVDARGNLSLGAAGDAVTTLYQASAFLHTIPASGGKPARKVIHWKRDGAGTLDLALARPVTGQIDLAHLGRRTPILNVAGALRLLGGTLAVNDPEPLIYDLHPATRPPCTFQLDGINFGGFGKIAGKTYDVIYGGYIKPAIRLSRKVK
jgi:hypothetical protein